MVAQNLTNNTGYLKKKPKTTKANYDTHPRTIQRFHSRPPFYISPLWDVVYSAFNIMFGLQDDDVIGNELSWWLEEVPNGEAKYWIDEKEYNVSDIDAFYDYLIEMHNESNNKTEEKQ